MCSFLLVCFVPRHFGLFQSTAGIDEHTLHTSVSTCGPKKQRLASTSDHFSPSGCCSRMIQLLYFLSTLPSTVNISTTWRARSRPPQKSCQRVALQVGLDRSWILPAMFATYFSFSQEVWWLPSPLFPRSTFSVVFSGCSIITALCLSSYLLCLCFRFKCTAGGRG